MNLFKLFVPCALALSSGAFAQAVSNVTLDPGCIYPGLASTATVWLTSAAKSSGFKVTLTSSNAGFSVPSSVTVPSGKSSATFSVTTVASATQFAWITATSGSSSRRVYATSSASLFSPLPSWIPYFWFDRADLNSTDGQANQVSGEPHKLVDGDSRKLSTDGRYQVFTSHASNLVSGDTDRHYEVFLRDRQQGTTVRVSQSANGGNANGDSYQPSISSDGSTVAFVSEASNIASGDTNGQPNIFVWTKKTGGLVCVTHLADDVSCQPSVSSNGAYVAFTSYASNLISSAKSGFGNIYVFNTAKGTLALASVATSGDTDGDSTYPSIDGDGRYVAFQSDADNLVKNDTNQDRDIFVRDLTKNTTTLVSVDLAGAELQGVSQFPSISSDGTKVVFTSYAPPPGVSPATSPWAGGACLLFRDLSTKTTTLLDYPGRLVLYYGSFQAAFDFVRPVISGNGRIVTVSTADWYDPNISSFLYSTLASDTYTQYLHLFFGLMISPYQPDYDVSVDSDGTYVAFTSLARGLVPDDTNGVSNVYAMQTLFPGVLGLLIGPNNNDAVLAGDSANATLALIQPAPAGGQLIELTCANPQGVNFPPSVTAPAGATTVTVPITTTSTSAGAFIQITASVEGHANIVSFDIVPLQITLSAYSITEGAQSLSGTVRVAVAPTADTTVYFYCSGPMQTNVPSVTLKANTKSVTFSIPLAVNQTPGQYSISASAGSSGGSMNFDVVPPAAAHR